MEPSLTVCDDGERWDGEEWEAPAGVEVCITMADWHCCIAETNTTLQKFKTKNVFFNLKKDIFYFQKLALSFEV